jgi:hypothetical protein
VSDYDTQRATRYLPHVVAATTAVAVIPAAVVWWLRTLGAITSAWTGVVLAVALSLVASLVGSAYWKRRRGPRDLLFGELLVWGWLRRLRMERQLGRAMTVLREHEELRDEVHTTDQKFRILSQLAVALEAQDAYTNGHSRRVAAHAVIAARRMGLSSGKVSRLRAAAAIHDIGKVRVPPDLLEKPARLTSAEFELVKRHADVGAEIVDCLGDRELTASVRHHHERFDGTGYPSGLAGEGIPLGARIIAVADTFDAMTSVRPYRPAASHQQALEALVEASGSQLDPAVVRAFLRSYSDSKAIVLWSLLAVSPQRAVAWLRDKRPAPTNVSLSSIGASVAAMTTLALTAIGTPIGPRPGASGGRDVRNNAPRAIVAARLPSTIFASPASSHRLTSRLHGNATQGSRQVSSVSIVARIPSPGSGSVHSRQSGPRSGGGGPGPKRSGGRGRAPAGGSTGTSGHQPAGGSTGSPGHGSGGGSASGTGAGSGSGAGSASGAPGPAGGSTAGSPSGQTGGTAGGSSGSPGQSASGSRGASGAARSPGPTGAGRASTKDQCKNDGYVQYGFANQGKCVAFVEPGSR